VGVGGKDPRALHTHCLQAPRVNSVGGFDNNEIHGKGLLNKTLVGLQGVFD
jgi:hypothetical protein